MTLNLPGNVRVQPLFDGDGRHVGGLYPPLKEGNALTQFYRNFVAERPYQHRHGVEPEAGWNLALVYMAPLGMGPATPLYPEEIMGLLVEALDRGQGIIVHADRWDTALCIVCQAVLWMGGGRA